MDREQVKTLLRRRIPVKQFLPSFPAVMLDDGIPPAIEERSEHSLGFVVADHLFVMVIIADCKDIGALPSLGHGMVREGIFVKAVR